MSDPTVQLTAEDVVDEIRDGLCGVDRVYALKRADAHALVQQYGRQECSACAERYESRLASAERERDALKAALAAEQRMRADDAEIAKLRDRMLKNVEKMVDDARAQLAALEGAHGQLIVDALRYRTERDEANARLANYEAVMVLSTPRGCA